MKKRIFIIDDEPDMARIAQDLLEEEGFSVSSFTTPKEGMEKLIANPPNLLLLDIRLPEKDGFSVCKEIKSNPKIKHVPVIMVSVKSEETDVVVGLEVGAEDYISKPFRKKELIARVKAVLRRTEGLPVPQKIESGAIEIDYASYSARINKKALDLTPKEFELLWFFVQNPGRVLRRALLSENVWGVEFTNSTRTIDVHVDQVRKKLGKFGFYIQSLKGVGYKFDPD